MTWMEVVLILAGLVVLAASIVTVLLGRRSELANERMTAGMLEHVATTVDQLNAELSSRRGETERLHEARLHSRAARKCDSDEPQTEGRRAIYHLRFAAPMTTAEPHNVIDLWDTLTREASESESYRAVLGPTLHDAIFHAANMGVMDREQAEAFAYWTETTAAIARPSRVKVDATAHARMLRSVSASA